MSVQLMATVADGHRNRIFLAPTDDQVTAALAARPPWEPEQELADDPRNLWTVNYGLTHFRDLFTPRQLTALSTLCDLVAEARERVLADAIAAGIPHDRPLSEGGVGAEAYADAVAIYLGFAISKLADWSSALCSWIPQLQGVGHTFKRQALPMIWDFVEINVLSASVGNFLNHAEWVAESVEAAPATGTAKVQQLDAANAIAGVGQPIVSTDPPYYDNISYADLADFFYVWLRRSVGAIYPELFRTLLTPKAAELVATPYRFGGDKSAAEHHFESGLGAAFEQMRTVSIADVPLTVYYAFKQAEVSSNRGPGDTAPVASTGWETMLEGLLRSGFSIVGTWPIRTERSARSISLGTNALASSIVIVCRPRGADAPLATMREFASALATELPAALKGLQDANIAPVDVAQAAIGPGIGIFSRYSGVLEASGERMRVRRALEMVNSEVDGYLESEHGVLDPDTRWCLTWFKANGFAPADYGSAETLATARNVSVSGLMHSGVLEARARRVRLLRPSELDVRWDPLSDDRLSIWECAHQLVRALHDPRGGVEGAAHLVAKMGHGRADEAKDLAYSLFSIADRRKWLAEAALYNDLVVDWPAILDRASAIGATGRQESLGL